MIGGSALARRREHGEQRRAPNAATIAVRITRSRARPYRRCREVGSLEPRIGEDEQREARVPEHIEPGGALRAGPEQTRRREEPGKGERMKNRDERREYVRACEDQHRARAHDRVLAEEKGGRDESLTTSAHS
jgi:hypothetical protein